MFRRLLFLYQALRVFCYRRASNCRQLSGKAKHLQPVLLLGKGSISFGNNVKLGYFPSPQFFNSYSHIESRTAQSNITIGNNVMINNNCFICSEGAGIFIGDDCLIGHNVQIFDTDFHALDPERRKSGEPKQGITTLGSNVFIGTNAIICKGVTIGDNSVIGAGAVVTASIPSNVIAAGNPAITIKKL